MPDRSIDSPKPRFLIFLCLLTFFSSVSGLWVTSERLWNPGVAAYQQRQVFEKAQEQMEVQVKAQNNAANEEFMAAMYKSLYAGLTLSNTRILAVIILLYNILTLYGAYHMWYLERRGFYLYLAGLSVVILAPFLLVGGWLGAVTALQEGFGSAILALVYRTYLKHMT